MLSDHDRQAVDLRSLLEAALTEGSSKAVSQSSGVPVMIVHAAESDWSAARLSVVDAVALLRRSLRLLVENRRADFQFLKRLAPRLQRRRLDLALEGGELEVEQGGGLGEITARLKELAHDGEASLSQRARRVARLRLCVVFDRDSNPHDRRVPSAASQRLVERCAEPGQDDRWPLLGYQLARRAIENYLPNQVLNRWDADATGVERKRRSEAVTALCELRTERPEAAWQYNMKLGLSGDIVDGDRRRTVRESLRDPAARRPETAATILLEEDLDSLFSDLAAERRGALAWGFGSDIAESYDAADIPVETWEQWIEPEYNRGPRTQPRRAALLDSILERI